MEKSDTMEPSAVRELLRNTHHELNLILDQINKLGDRCFTTKQARTAMLAVRLHLVSTQAAIRQVLKCLEE